MRVLDKIISFLFSMIMLVVSIILILVGIGNIEPEMIIHFLSENVFNREVIASGIFNPITLTGIVLFLAALKTTVFLSLFKIKSKTPIIVKTINGDIQIAQETITTTARNASLAFDNIKDVQAYMVKKGKGVVVYENVQVYSNTNIRELTAAVQNAVKEQITSTTGVLVRDVNIRIKNVVAGGKKKESNEIKLSDYSPSIAKNEHHTSDINLDETVKTIDTPEAVEPTNIEVKEEETSKE